MEEVVQRFPHLAQNIFEKLDNQTVSNCRQISRNCNALINDQKFYWIRITENCLRDPEKSFIKILMQNNIPTVRKIALAAREYVYEDTLNTLRKKICRWRWKSSFKKSNVDLVTLFSNQWRNRNFQKCI